MVFSLQLTIDSHTIGESVARKKSELINAFAKQVNIYFNGRDYGNDIQNYLISLYVINPPKGYEHLHKDFKPKYTEYKALENRYTGEKMVIEKQFHYNIKITGERFDEFISSSETEARKILAHEILNSLYSLDALPKKIKQFDKERFTEDIKQLFISEKLI